MDGVYEQFGGIGTYSLMKVLTEVIRYIEDETGKSWQDDRNTYEQVEIACKVIFNRYGPETVRRATAALDEAEQLAKECGATSLQPFICHARAAVAESAGDAEGMQRELANADRLYAAIGISRRASAS